MGINLQPPLNTRQKIFIRAPPEESIASWPGRLLRGLMRKTLAESLDTWLQSLKKQAVGNNDSQYII